MDVQISHTDLRIHNAPEFDGHPKPPEETSDWERGCGKRPQEHLRSDFAYCASQAPPSESLTNFAYGLSLFPAPPAPPAPLEKRAAQMCPRLREVSYLRAAGSELE